MHFSYLSVKRMIQSAISDFRGNQDNELAGSGEVKRDTQQTKMNGIDGIIGIFV
jgi:hypothetical protein